MTVNTLQTAQSIFLRTTAAIFKKAGRVSRSGAIDSVASFALVQDLDLSDFTRNAKNVLRSAISEGGEALVAPHVGRFFEDASLSSYLNISLPSEGQSGVAAFGGARAFHFISRVSEGQDLAGIRSTGLIPSFYYYFSEGLLDWGGKRLFSNLPVVQSLLPQAYIQALFDAGVSAVAPQLEILENRSPWISTASMAGVSWKKIINSRVKRKPDAFEDGETLPAWEGPTPSLDGRSLRPFDVHGNALQGVLHDVALDDLLGRLSS